MRCLPTVVSAAAWQNGVVAAMTSCDITCCGGASIGDAGCQTTMREDMRDRLEIMRTGQDIAPFLDPPHPSISSLHEGIVAGRRGRGRLWSLGAERSAREGGRGSRWSIASGSP